MNLLDNSAGLTLFHYIFLRKVNYALDECGDNGYLRSNKIYCALAITSPRTRHLAAPEEKTLYTSAIVLSDGFYFGQTSYLNVTQFLGLSYLYNYFSDYEIPFSDGMVGPQDFIRAS